MTNKASQLLAQTTAATQANAVDMSEGVDTAQALERLGSSTPNVSGADLEDGKAGFGFPEGLATAALGTIIGGPVLGVALGAAQGWLAKESKQAVLDQMVSENNALHGAADVTRDTLSGFIQNAAPEDMPQLANLAGALHASEKLMANASTQQAGIQAHQSVVERMHGYAAANETQAIAKDAADVAAKTELTNTQYQQHKDIQARFETDAEKFTKAAQHIDLARNGFNRGTSADVVSGITRMVKLIDPEGGVVTEGEVKAWAGLGNRAEKLLGLIDSELGSGSGMSEDTRKEVNLLLNDMEGVAVNQMRWRESVYEREATAIELPTRYSNQYKVVDSIPRFQAQEFSANKSAMENAITDEMDQSSIDLGDRVDTAKATLSDQAIIGGLMDFVNADLAGPRAATSDAIESTVEFAGEAGAAIKTGANKAEQFMNNMLRRTTQLPTN